MTKFKMEVGNSTAEMQKANSRETGFSSTKRESTV